MNVNLKLLPEAIYSTQCTIVSSPKHMELCQAGGLIGLDSQLILTTNSLHVGKSLDIQLNQVISVEKTMQRSRCYYGIAMSKAYIHISVTLISGEKLVLTSKLRYWDLDKHLLSCIEALRVDQVNTTMPEISPLRGSQPETCDFEQLSELLCSPKPEIDIIIPLMEKMSPSQHNSFWRSESNALFQQLVFSMMNQIENINKRYGIQIHDTEIDRWVGVIKSTRPGSAPIRYPALPPKSAAIPPALVIKHCEFLAAGLRFFNKVIGPATGIVFASGPVDSRYHIPDVLKIALDVCLLKLEGIYSREIHTLRAESSQLTYSIFKWATRHHCLNQIDLERYEPFCGMIVSLNSSEIHRLRLFDVVVDELHLKTSYRNFLILEFLYFYRNARPNCIKLWIKDELQRIVMPNKLVEGTIYAEIHRIAARIHDSNQFK